MKLKLLLVLVFYGSSAYALQTAYWDNFLKAFNDFKKQMAETCKVKEDLDYKNENFTGDRLFLDEKDIRLAWWGVQKDKAKGTRLLNQIDGITSDEVMETLLKNQNKNDDLNKQELQKITSLLNKYIGNVINGIKKGKVLAKAYSDLMSAPDDAPPSLQRLKDSFMECPVGIQVSVNWKKKAEDMIKSQCPKACSKEKLDEDKSNCEKHFEFREGAAAYLIDFKKPEQKCSDFERAYRSLDPIRLYSEMKEEMIDLVHAQSELKKCKEGYVALQRKSTKLKSAAKLAIDSLHDQNANYKKTIEDLKTTYDEIFPSKPAPSKP